MTRRTVPPILTEQHPVLCTGKDPVLLLTRKQLLVKAGFFAYAAPTVSTARQYLGEKGVSVLVLCHTLDAAEAQEMAAFCHQANSAVKILCLTTGSRPPSLDCTHTCNSSNGPGAFLAAVRWLSDEPNIRAANGRPCLPV